jgi:hypothetical protein
MTGQTRVTYYAALSDKPPHHPIGIIRRHHNRPPPHDEAFGRDSNWHPTEALMRAQLLGTSDIDYEEITAEEAQAVIDRWRREGVVP